MRKVLPVLGLVLGAVVPGLVILLGTLIPVDLAVLMVPLLLVPQTQKSVSVFKLSPDHENYLKLWGFKVVFTSQNELNKKQKQKKVIQKKKKEKGEMGLPKMNPVSNNKTNMLLEYILLKS